MRMIAKSQSQPCSFDALEDGATRAVRGRPRCRFPPSLAASGKTWWASRPQKPPTCSAADPFRRPISGWSRLATPANVHGLLRQRTRRQRSNLLSHRMRRRRSIGLLFFFSNRCLLSSNFSCSADKERVRLDTSLLLLFLLRRPTNDRFKHPIN